MKEQQVWDYIDKNHMLEGVSDLIVGVSGGADSVCLLYLLKEYAKTHPLKLYAAHVHHGLRKSADGDEAHVKKICEDWDIPLKILHIDAKAEAEALGVSVEEAGRIKRYEFFRKLKETAGENTKIAVAHHRDDLCETMLFQLFRGSGISGIRGIRPVTEEIIRPLLDCPKEEIEAFLKERNIAWCVDETNLENTFTRNRIRHEMMPLAEEICPGASEHMAQAAKKLRDAEDFLKAEADRVENTYLAYAKDDSEVLIKNEIKDLPKALLGELLLRALCRVAGRKRDIGSVQTEALAALLDAERGKERDFLYGLYARKDYSGVVLTKTKNAQEPSGEDFLKKMTLTVIPDPDFTKIPAGEDAKWFDADLTGYNPVLRRAKEGDYLIVTKEGGRKSLKDFFRDEKLTDAERREVLVVAREDLVLWVVGHRMGEYGKITAETKKVLEVRISKE